MPPWTLTGRFAPSPTGPLHFGSLVAAVASYADARATNGRWLVRIEDVDVPRTVPGAARAIEEALQRHGMVSDEPPVHQSARTAHYEHALRALRAAGLVYECACTRSDLATAPLRHGERVYPGDCREGVAPDRAGRTQRSVRLRVGHATIAFDDRVQGRQVQALADETGDFVLKRADGWFAYQLAVVVDDAAQGITSIVRGADLLASTPRQIFLQQCLGVPTPSYLHVPIAVDAAGRKFSKATGAAALGGNPCEALQRVWRFLDQVPLSSCDSPVEFWAKAIPAWSVARIPRVAAYAPIG